MPHSAGENVNYVKEFLLQVQPKTVIDIGAGSMLYGQLVKEVCPDARTIAIEIWEPYIQKFNYKTVYDEVYHVDARKITRFDADVIIAGDVLEHMTELEMKKIVDLALKGCKFLVLSVPIIYYPQGHIENNPYEEHIQENLNHDELVRILGPPFMYQDFIQTGTYIYKGKE